MKVKFWGTRGSIPVALTAADIRRKLHAAFVTAIGQDLSTEAKIESHLDSLGFDITGTYGGHTSCVQIDLGTSEHVICDFGNGARPLAQAMLGRFGPASPQTYHVFMSHVHWDHIMGFPFFTPVYIPGNRIVIHSCHAHVEEAFRRQQEPMSFPVEFGQLAATIEFVVLQPDQTYDIAGMKVRAQKQHHSGDSYGWRFEHGGKTLIYSTDSEHPVDDIAGQAAIVDFFRDADAVIFDAMYSLAEATSVKADWGHSSNIVGVELCQQAKAKRLLMFHHEPANDDLKLGELLDETRRYEEITREEPGLEVMTVWDGLEITL
jgi:phosphoribosyl 1,2-cyclic phosphodiesterase